jgi:hypothetical protein
METINNELSELVKETNVHCRIDKLYQELTKLNLRVSLLEHGKRPKEKEKQCKQ